MKMRFLCVLAGVACFFAFRSSVLAAADAAPLDLRKALTTLKSIRERHNTDEKTMQGKAVQELEAASASNTTAINFYQDVVIFTQFGSKDAPGAQQWLSKEQDNLRSEAMQNAARLHIKYLLLTIQRSSGATTRQLEPALLKHIADLQAAGARDAVIQAERDKAKDANAQAKNSMLKNRKVNNTNQEPLFWDQDLIKQDINSSVFVKFYGIQPMIANAKEWESAPGNIDGIYQNTLLSYFRQIKDPRLIAYWDDKIQKEAQRAATLRVAFKADQVNNVRRPQLIWSRALDMIAIGQRNRGMGEMLELIKSTPNHPDMSDWIAQLEKIIASATPAETAASGSTNVAAAATPRPTPAAPVAPAAPVEDTSGNSSALPFP